VLAVGDVPLGRLWSHLVLGLLAARRDAPVENPQLDELWRLATKLDVAGVMAPVVAALAEQAWITRRADPRLDESLVTALADLPGLGGDQLRRWVRRLTAAGVQHVGAHALPSPDQLPEQQPYERALALWDGGSAGELLAALALLDELDAHAVAVKVRERLRELGVTNLPRSPSPTTRANPAGLTERQLDVLALLVQGLSNADIAARLVISRKTADHHVSAILAKLGVRSRGEAVAAARRLGLDGLTPPPVLGVPGAR
jgi:DNA-binding CsgD family transcriptional regulator